VKAAFRISELCTWRDGSPGMYMIEVLDGEVVGVFELSSSIGISISQPTF